MEIYLIRHTTPDVGQGICYGQSDLDLAASFGEEYAVLRPKLPKECDIIYSSPLFRCKELALELDFPMVTDDRLMEYNFGDWEMRAWKAIPKEDIEPWMKDYVHVRSPNGESYLDLFHRVKSFWEDVVLNGSHGCVFLTIHGGVIRSILSLLLELPLENAFRMQVDYGSVSKVSFKRDSPLIEYINR